MNGRRQKRHSQRSGKKTKEVEGVGKSDQSVEHFREVENE